jgi:hypothetical protein
LRAAATASSAASSSSSKKVAEAEKVTKDVAEILEDTGIETGGSRGGAAYASVPETVIQSALFLISQDRVRFAALFEPLFSVRVIGIPVGMVLQRELAIRALYFDVGSGTAYAQDLVIITFTVGCRNKLPRN